MKIPEIRLIRGCNHFMRYSGEGCIMNVCSYLSGDQDITDRPKCVHLEVRDVAIWLNDTLKEGPRQRLLPFVLRLMESHRLPAGYCMSVARDVIHDMYADYSRYLWVGRADSSAFQNATTPHQLLVMFAQYHGMSAPMLVDIMFKYLDRVLPKVDEEYVKPEVEAELQKLYDLVKNGPPRTSAPNFSYQIMPKSLADLDDLWVDIKKEPVFTPYIDFTVSVNKYGQPVKKVKESMDVAFMTG